MPKVKKGKYDFKKIVVQVVRQQLSQSLSITGHSVRTYSTLQHPASNGRTHTRTNTPPHQHALTHKLNNTDTYTHTHTRSHCVVICLTKL